MDEKEKRFQRLCRDELQYLRGGVFRIVGNAADTDDTVQEALLRAYRRYSSFRGDAELRSWVYKIALNCAFDLLRERKRTKEIEQKYAGGQPDKAAPAADPRMAQLEEAVAGLPELYREAIVWGCLSDLPGREAAERLGCSENTLYQRVFKAKQLLKQAMEDEEER